MSQSILEKLEAETDEILSKAEKPDDLDPKNISEDAEPDGDNDPDEPEGDDDNDGEVEKSEGVGILDDDDLSEKMSGLVEIFAKSLADVVGNISDAQEYNENSSSLFAKSLLAQNSVLRQHAADLEKTNRSLTKLNKSLAEKLDAIDAKLDEISSQPAHMRKSVGSYSFADRDFKGSLEGSGEPEEKPLSKSEILNILTNEVMNGSNIVTDQDVLAIEAGAPVREELRALINTRAGR